MRHPYHQILLLLALCAALPVVCAAQRRRSQQSAGHTGRIVTVAFAPDGKKIVSGSYDQTVKLWDARTGRLLRTIRVYPKKIRTDGIIGSVAFAPDSRTVVAGARYAPIEQWEVATGDLLRLFHGYVCGADCSDVAFSPDGKLLAGGDGRSGTVKIWDVASGQIVRTFEKPRDEKNPRFAHDAEHILFSPDGKKLFTDSGPAGPIQVWEVATGRELLRFETKAIIKAMRLSPDGRTLMIGGSLSAAPRGAKGLIALIDAETGRALRVFPPQWSEVEDVAFAPGGRLAASAGYDVTDGIGAHVVKLWDPATGEETGQLTGHSEAIHAIAFAPDGKTIVSGSQDATLRLWDVATGKELRRFPAGPAPAGGGSNDAPRAVTSGTFSAGVMYWATPLPVLCRDWYVVLGGTVLETHREVIPELAKQRYTAGTLKVERVFLSQPTEKEAAPAGFVYFKSDGFDGLRRGDKVIVFVGEYDGGYGIIEAAGSNSKLGIKVRSWDEPIVKAVEAITRDAQTAKLPGDRYEVLKDPQHAKAWRPFNGKGVEGKGCLQ